METIPFVDCHWSSLLQ